MGTLMIYYRGGLVAFWPCRCFVEASEMFSRLLDDVLSAGPNGDDLTWNYLPGA